LSEFVTPTSTELAFLDGASHSRRQFKRNQLISSQGEPVREVYFLAEGWVGAFLDVNFGRHQLAKVYLPGDFAGLPNIAMSQTAESLVALTNVTLDVLRIEQLGRLFETAPRFAFNLFVTSQQERVMLMDQLAVVGQSSAIQRVAALLVHFHRRLSVLQPDAGDVIDWPLSQQRVAQGAGLTAIHVNRTFRELTRRGLIAREGKQIRFLDVDGLWELAGLPERSWVKDPRWLAECCGGGD
jgi:CRP-like cAMP-binding protein